MKQLSLNHCLKIKPPAVVSFYGAGGKTTLLRKLALEMTEAGQKVLLTTTTKMFIPPDIPVFYEEDIKKGIKTLKEHYKHHDVAVLAKQVIEDGKLEGIDPAAPGELKDQLEVSVLVEADGAKGRPIKGYAEHEPVLPTGSDLIIPVIGADALGAPLLEERVHRLDRLLPLTENKVGGTITEQIIASAFMYMLKLGQAQAPQARVYFILNKNDLLESSGSTALKIGRLLSNKDQPAEQLLIVEGKGFNPVRITINLVPGKPLVSVACIILAAGQSTRMGCDKLSLKTGHSTILGQTLQQVIAAGVKDIILITRPGFDCSELPGKEQCRIIENPLYKTGMSSSLQAGLSAVEENTQGAIFALGDQPMVPAEVYSLLCQTYQNNLKLLTAPIYKGKRGNPTLLDRRTWPDLMQISGDKGGRSVINKLTENEVDYIETNLSAILTDIDSPEDYRHFLNGR